MSTEMTLDQIATDINAMCVCRHCDEWVSGIRAEIAKKSGGEQPVAWMASHAGGAIVGDAERTAIMARRGGNGSTYPIPLYAAPRHTGEVTDEMVETGIAVWKRETRCDVSQGLMRMVLRECFAAQPKAEVVQPVEAVAMLVEAKTKLARAVGTAESGPSKLWVREVNSAAWDIKRAMDALAHPRPMGDAKSTHLPSDLRAFVMLLDKLADEWCAEEGETFRPAYELRSQVAAFVTLQPDSRRSRKGTVAAPTGGQAGEVVALRIVGRNGPYGWHDASEMDRENPPETIVGEGERVEYAYAQPRPVGVPEPHTKDHYEQDEDEQIDTYSVGHMDGWNSCREAMLAAAPAPGDSHA